MELLTDELAKIEEIESKIERGEALERLMQQSMMLFVDDDDTILEISIPTLVEVYVDMRCKWLER